MRIATWNVNSLRSRIDRVEALLERHEIDVLALQETKAREDQLPLMGLQALGYDVAVAGTNQWNGVAIICRVGLEDVTRRLRRHARVRRPAGRRVAGDRRHLRRRTHLVALRPQRPQARRPALRLQARLAGPAARGGRRSWLDGDTALVGDWNICPTDDDVFDLAQFAKSTHVTPPERAAFQGFLDDGYVEVTREHAPGYTYWDYYRQRFERDRGLQIDFVLGSPSLAGAGDRRLHRPRRARPGPGQRVALRPRAGDRRPRLRSRSARCRWSSSMLAPWRS